MLISSLILSYLYGGYGMAISLLLTELFSFFIHYLLIKKMNKNSSVAVIVVNWKKYDISEKCIESILECDYPNFKILVVDNESDNKKVKNFKFRNEIEIIQNKKNEGFSKANNIGIDYALKNNYDYTILINNDTIVEKNLIEVLLKTAQAKIFQLYNH